MKKKWIFASLLVLLLLITLFQLDRESLLYSIRQIPLWLALLLFAMQIVSQLLVNIQWHQIAKLSETDMSFSKMLYINAGGSVMDSITPGVKFGGEITRAYQLSSLTKCSGEQALAIVALQKLFSLSALFTILLFTMGYLIGEVPLFQTIALQFLIYGLLLLFLLFFVCIFVIPSRIMAYLQARKVPKFSWLRRTYNFFITTLSHVENIRRNKKAWIALSLLSFLIWLLYPVKMYLLTAQFAPDVSIIHIAAITFAAYMVALLPIFPGGLGGFEGTMAGLLLLAGLATSDAAVITIFFRFVTFWFVMILSLGYIASYKAKFSKSAVKLPFFKHGGKWPEN
jgi:uncharacterized protein (TIRG00374 family)